MYVGFTILLKIAKPGVPYFDNFYILAAATAGNTIIWPTEPTITSKIQRLDGGKNAFGKFGYMTA